MITIRYGGSSVTRDINGYESILDVVCDEALGSVLGFSSERVEASVEGLIRGRDCGVEDGDIIDLVARPNTKG